MSDKVITLDMFATAPGSDNKLWCEELAAKFQLLFKSFYDNTIFLTMPDNVNISQWLGAVYDASQALGYHSQYLNGIKNGVSDISAKITDLMLQFNIKFDQSNAHLYSISQQLGEIRSRISSLSSIMQSTLSDMTWVLRDMTREYDSEGNVIASNWDKINQALSGLMSIAANIQVGLVNIQVSLQNMNVRVDEIGIDLNPLTEAVEGVSESVSEQGVAIKTEIEGVKGKIGDQNLVINMYHDDNNEDMIDSVHRGF